MTASKFLTTATAVAALATAGVTGNAAAADAPVVSSQAWVAGHALVDVPGTGIQKGEWMGSRAKLLFRQVTLSDGQSVRVTFRAPKGTKIRGIGARSGQQLAVRALDTDYAGDRKLTVSVSVAPNASADEVTERVYVLVR